MINGPFGKTYHIDTMVVRLKGSSYPQELPGKEGNVELTKEKLEYLRHTEGKTNEEIAKQTGKSVYVISNLFSKYKIPQRDRALPKQVVEQILEMHAAGSSTSEIAKAVGYSTTAVYYCKKAAGLIKSNEADLPKQVIEERKPKIFRTVINGKRWLDITDLYM